MNKSFNFGYDYINQDSNDYIIPTISRKSGYLTSSDPNRSLKSKLRFLKFTRKSSSSISNLNKDSKSNEKIPELPTFQSIKYFKYYDEVDIGNKKKENSSVVNLDSDAVAEIGTVHAEAEIFNNEFTSSRKYIIEQSKKNTSKINFKNIPKNTGIPSIISQVSGGGLREISVSYKDKKNKVIEEFQIEFKDRENATKFMKYSSSNYFKVNGVHISPEWSLNTKFDHCPLNLKTFNIKEVSRALVLKQHPNRVRKFSKCKEINMPLYPLNVAEMVNDFSMFGEILSIAPVVSRKLCVSIFFMNIESAINAVEEFQRSGSPFSIKYSKAWIIWFGKDTTDIPCMEF